MAPVVLAEAICRSPIEHCKLCNGISDPAYEHQNWNVHWIGCKKCGEAYHRSCIIDDLKEKTGFFEPIPIRAPCNPRALSSEPGWTCNDCLECVKCKSSTVSNRNECSKCHRSFCEGCKPTGKDLGPLWKGYFWICNQGCQPSCINCNAVLSNARWRESRWCLGCKQNWMKGHHCPTCLKAYDEDSEGEAPMIQCGSCDVWVHYPCTGLEAEALKKLEKSEKSEYICYRCTKSDPIKKTDHICVACSSVKADSSLPPADVRLVQVSNRTGRIIWSHRSCLAFSDHLVRSPKHIFDKSEIPFFNRHGIRSVASNEKSFVLRYWKIKAAGFLDQRQDIVIMKGSKGLSLSCNFGEFRAASPEELLTKFIEKLEGIRSFAVGKRTKLEATLLNGLNAWLRPTNKIEPVKKKPKLDQPKKQEEKLIVTPVKDLLQIEEGDKENSPNTQSPAIVIVDDFHSARTRALAYTELVSNKRIRLSKEMSLVFGDVTYPKGLDFDVNMVPLRSNDDHYTRVSLPMAYRSLLGSVKRGDLQVAKSKVAGYGLFTTRRYIRNELVIEYVGEIIGKAVSDIRETKIYANSPRHKHSCYMFKLDEYRVIDATLIGNAARFINHCCQPNCRTRTFSIDGQQHILILALRDIQAGEELFYDYQFALDEDGKERLPCYCGAPKCRGWMN